MPGIQDFTYMNIGKETVRGTPVAPTRQLYMEGTGVLDPDPGLNFHEAENRGRRSTVARVTSQSEDVAWKCKSAAGIDWDSLVFPLTQTKGGMTGVGGGADKTWTAAPSMTGANSPESFSIDVGDDVQNFRIQYGMLKSWKLSSAQGELTELQMSGFGQRSVKVAKATPAANLSPKIPGDLWTAKYSATFAGLAGAAVQTNLLLDWELEVLTGLVWRHYQDGNLYGAQHVETAIGGTLKMTVESTAFAISEFYDKWQSQTGDYVRLKATGGALGASNYSLQLDLPILYSNVPPIGKADEGINLYEISANLWDDGTNPIINPILVCSLAAIP